MPGTFYTRGGDDGTTGLLGAGRVGKEDIRIEAVGAVDEAGAALGLARAASRIQETSAIILQVQRDLYGMMAELAATPENAKRFRAIDTARVAWLELQVDTISAMVEIPKEFIVPGDTLPGAHLDVARAVVRRAERRVVALYRAGSFENTEILRYLNRLSSLCFVLELLEHAQAGQGGESGSKISLAKAD